MMGGPLGLGDFRAHSNSTMPVTRTSIASHRGVGAGSRDRLAGIRRPRVRHARHQQRLPGSVSTGDEASARSSRSSPPRSRARAALPTARRVWLRAAGRTGRDSAAAQRRPAASASRARIGDASRSRALRMESSDAGARSPCGRLRACGPRSPRRPRSSSPSRLEPADDRRERLAPAGVMWQKGEPGEHATHEEPRMRAVRSRLGRRQAGRRAPCASATDARPARRVRHGRGAPPCARAADEARALPRGRAAAEAHDVNPPVSRAQTHRPALSLLEPHRRPRQVVVNNPLGPAQVQAFGRDVGGHEASGASSATQERVPRHPETNCMTTRSRRGAGAQPRAVAGTPGDRRRRAGRAGGAPSRGES